MAFLVVSTDLLRNLLVPRLVRMADDALAGRIELDGFRLLARGGVELRGVRVVDPDGDVVLRAERARLSVDLSRIRSKVVGAQVDVDRPEIVLKREEDGGLSLARAFAPARPRPKPPDQQPFDWTVRVTHLAIRGGSVSYVDAAGKTAFAAERLEADARGAYGPRGARVELSLRGAMTAPEAAPLSLEVAGALRGTQVRVRTLRAAAGDTALDLAADFDWVSWKGRAALLALAVDAKAVRDLAPRAPLAGDLAGTLYAESDGGEATAALALRPDHGRAGSADAAAAVRLAPAPTAFGVDLAAEKLDLARVLRGAPATSLTLTARGRAAGRDLATLRGALSLSLSPSRVRGGRVGPAEIRAAADRGAVEVSRLEASLPGATLRGRGTWRSGGAIDGQLAADAPDLAALREALAAVLDRPLPPVAGAARVEANVGGTQSAPSATVRLSSPALLARGVSITGLALSGDLAGPLAALRARVEGGADRVVTGRLDVRSARVRGQVTGRAGDLTVTAAVPTLGQEPLTLAGAAALDGGVVTVTALALSWPGERFQLERPARIDLRGPAVDQLVLASGRQRIALEGGLAGAGRRRTVDARAAVAELDLARLPLRALLPPRLTLAGRASVTAAITGPLAAPRATARLDLADGDVAGVAGVAATAEIAYDGKARRAVLDLGAQRATGGELSAKGEIPTSLAGDAPLALRVVVKDVPVAEAIALAGSELPLAGIAAAELQLGGTAGRPEISAVASIERASWRELGPFSATARLEDAGDEARLVASADWRGARAADLEVLAPLATALLLREPARAARGLATAPLRGTASVPGLDLATLAGELALPEDLRGRLAGTAELTGTARAPRGTVRLVLSGVAVAGYAGLGLDATLSAREGAVAVAARAAIEQDELAVLNGEIGAPAEALADLRALDAAPMNVVLELRRGDLSRAGVAVPLAGELAGKIEGTGTLAAPRLAAQLEGHDLKIAGHPLGELRLKARSADGVAHGEMHLDVASGGTLDGTLDVAGELGLETVRRGELARAPAQAKLVASNLDLGVLPALAPGRVRSAAGKLGADIVAAGPLRRLAPKGTLALEGGKITIAEYGEWTGIALQASLSEDVFRLEKLAARAARGGGSLDAKAQAVGLARAERPADLSGEVHADGLAIPHGGQDLATVTADLAIKGSVSRDALDAEVQVPRTVVKLPNRTPRKIQPLGDREDIVVGPFKKKVPAPAAAAGAAAARPYHAKVRVVVPNQFWVKSDSPRIDIELKGDVRAEWEQGGEIALDGYVESLRGEAEPFGGKKFDVKRARVEFSGEEYKGARLDVIAVAPNPGATVTAVNVAVTGTVEKPQIKLTSDPPMDEGQIALLLATGRTELKANSGGAGGLTEQATGAATAAAGAYLMGEFRSLIADKLPVDSVAIDASQLRAGKYLSDKLYVGYTYRRNADPEKGENTNEVRLEFQISPRWMLEGRAGDAGTGGGSLIWSKDY